MSTKPHNKHKETRRMLAALALTQSVVHTVRLLFHRLVQALQILHEQGYHLSVHLQRRGSKGREGYMSQSSTHFSTEGTK